MRPSRGMGAINPSKMPKGKKMARRDDTDFDQYAEGGEVGGDARDVADLSTESKSGGVRTQMFGEGAGGKGAVGAGGRLNFHKKLSDTSDLSAYIEGNVGKGRGQDLRGRMTGAGVAFTKRFAEGGQVWDKPRPKGLGKPSKLSPAKKASAKAAAKAAGRPYPNLIDNMRAAKGK